MRLTAHDTLMRVTDFAIIITVRTRLITLLAPFVRSSVRCEIIVTFSLAYAWLITVHHQELVWNSVSVEPTRGAAESVVFFTARARVVTLQKRNQYLVYNISHVTLSRIRIRLNIKPVIRVPPIVLRIHHVLKHDSDFLGKRGR